MLVSGGTEVAGKIVEQQGHVGGTLDVGLPPQGVDAPARYANVAQEELEDGRSAHVLGAHRVLSLAHGVHDGPRLVRSAGGAVELSHLEKLLFRRAADLLHKFRREAGKVLLQVSEGAVGVIEACRLLGHGHLLLDRYVFAGDRVLLRDRDRLLLLLILPRRGVIRPRLGIIAGEKAIEVGRTLEVWMNECEGVCVVLDVLLVVEPVLERVVDQATEEDDVGAWAQWHVEIGGGRRAGEAGVDDDKLGAVLVPRLIDPGHGRWMVLSRVGALDQDAVGVLDVSPVIGHGTAAKRGAETGHRSRVSDAGLVL